MHLHEISVAELRQKLANHQDVVLIDVREPHEHDEFNIGGENKPLGDIQSWHADLQDEPEREIVLYCRTGNRSGMAARYLMMQGLPNVANLIGGVEAWKEAT